MGWTTFDRVALLPPRLFLPRMLSWRSRGRNPFILPVAPSFLHGLLAVVFPPLPLWAVLPLLSSLLSSWISDLFFRPVDIIAFNLGEEFGSHFSSGQWQHFCCDTVNTVCPDGWLLGTCQERGVGTALVWHLLLPAPPHLPDLCLNPPIAPRCLQARVRAPYKSPEAHSRHLLSNITGTFPPPMYLGSGCAPFRCPRPQTPLWPLVLAQCCPPAWSTLHPPYLAASYSPLRSQIRGAFIQRCCVPGLSLWLLRMIPGSLGPRPSHGWARHLWLYSPGSGRKDWLLPPAGIGDTHQPASQASPGQGWGGEGAGLSRRDWQCPSLASSSLSF